MALWYCQKVVDQEVPACDWELKACARFLSMLKQSFQPGCPYSFSMAHVVDACDFLEKLPHVKGFEGTVLLEPVQCWWVAGIFGFRDRDTGLRWVRQATLLIPRKNGKSLLSSGIAMFCATCEGEPGAEVIISAGSEEQALKVYGPIRAMIDLEPDLRMQYGAVTNRDKTEFKKTGGYIQPVATVAKNNDGFNPHVVIAEELHAQKQDVVSVLASAQGARRQPLFLSIGTAGRKAEGPAYDDMRQCQAVLLGRMSAPRMFVAMYLPDKDDDGQHFDQTLIEKLNPLYGVSLQEASIEKEMRDARQSPANLNEYKRTRLNIWSRAAGNLIEPEKWDDCADPALQLELLRGFPMYVGLDLASRNDLSAASFLVKVGDTLYQVAKFWIGRNVPRMKDDRFADAFNKWVDDGFLEATDLHGGTFVDPDAILELTLQMMKGHNVIGVALDDYQANHLASKIERTGVPTYIVRKNAKALTQSTNDLISRCGNPRLLQHDGNPVMGWCAANVVGHYDQNSNVLPKKESPNSLSSIDGFDAMVLANAIRLDDEAGVLGQEEDAKPNPYLNRGLLGVEA